MDQESLVCCSLVSGRIVKTIRCRHIGRRRNVDLAAVSNAQFLYPYLKSCALHRKSSTGTCGTVDDSVRILGKRESQDPELPKECLKLVGEEPTSVMPDGKTRQRNSPRYRNRRAFQKTQRRMYDCRT